MTKSISVFLDGLRVLAALVIFAAHIVTVFYAGTVWLPDHAMVIVFFVLSGYVIAFSTLEKKGSTAKRYVIARLSRLYSVVAPALLLSGLLLVCGWKINPDYYYPIIQNHEVARYLVTGAFLQSIWWWNFVPAEDGAFWSLGYEFWYYVIFGIMIFATNWRWKVALVFLSCLIVGLNVLLLFPIWLFGAVLYTYTKKLTLSRHTVILGLAIMVCATIFTISCLPEFPGKAGMPPLLYSASYLSDWILGLEVGTAIWLYTQAFAAFAYAEGFARMVHWSANHTFSLYLYHYPLLLLFAAAGIFNPYVWWQAILEIGLILALIIALSEVTEAKRMFWRKGLEYLWQQWEPHVRFLLKTY